MGGNRGTEGNVLNEYGTILKQKRENGCCCKICLFLNELVSTQSSLYCILLVIIKKMCTDWE